MWLSDTSVKRPVFAAVLSMLLVGFGILSFQTLQVREYPDISAPVLSVSASYPGASAAVMESQVTRLLEDAVSGVEGIESLTSRSLDGRSTINITFALDRNIDEAANDVRDRVSRNQGRLPQEVTSVDISKQDSDATPVIWLTIRSTGMAPLDLRDYVDRFIVDQFSVLPGVSLINVGGSGRPSVRVWIDRLELAARGLTVTDIEAALARENLELPAGRIDSETREFPVRVERGYRTPEDFRQLVIQRGSDGHLMRLGEVARVETASADSRQLFLTNGENTVSLGITKQSTANTVEVLTGINEVVNRLNQELPYGMTIAKNSDASVFINAAISGVYSTILITTLLVGLVIFLFLGSLRTTLIPMITVPVCLISAFIALNVLGYSINLITLLALVLSIGLVVDDSIVVLENIHRRIEKGEPPLLAAYKGTRQVGFAVIATTAVVVAVFAPIMFLTDNVGLIFSELAVTVSAAVIFSSVVALSLVPMLCSKMLKTEPRKPMIEKVFIWLADRYERTLRSLLEVSWVAVPVIAFVLFLVVVLFAVLPQEYAPQEDQRVFLAMVSAPEGTSYTKMASSVIDMEGAIAPYFADGTVQSYIQRVPGFGSNSPNSGIIAITLAPWDKSNAKTTDVMNELVAQWNQVPDLRTMAFMRQGLSRGGGSQLQFVLQGSTYEELAQWRDIVLERANEYPGISRIDSDLRETQSQVIVEIDRDRAAALGVSAQAVGRTLQTMLSEREVSTFEMDGEEYSVIMQALDHQRASPEDLTNIFVRANTGALVPLANLITIRNEAGIGTLNRYNRLRAVTLSGTLAPGYSLGEAIDFLNEVVATELPPAAKTDYKGQTLEYIQSSGGIWFTFAIAILVLYLVMAAQFESFIHPAVILFTVPLAVAGALLGLLVTGASLNIYSQIGIVMLIGIAAKNGILIVEFINQTRDAGREFRDAIIEASRIRFRPVVMTTASTVMSAIPLLVAAGPGSESRFVLGVVVFFGVGIASILTLFLVPMMYDLLARHTGTPRAVADKLEAMQSRPAT